jgi:hypothetical protein
MSEVVVRAQEISWEISQELIQEISLRPYRATCLLRDYAGGLLLRVLAKEAQKRKEPPVSLLMVYPDVSLYDEARGYAGSIEAYIGLGLEGFLDEVARKAGSERLVLPVRGMEVAVARRDGWGEKHLSRLFLWPWPEPSPSAQREDWSEPLRDAERLRENILFSVERIHRGFRQRWARIADRLGLDGVAVVLHERSSPTQPDPNASGLTLCAIFSDKARGQIKRWMSSVFPCWRVEISTLLAPVAGGF